MVSTMSNHTRFWARQPGKGSTRHSLFFPCPLPFLVIYYVPPGLRPHSKWTHKQAFTNEITKLNFSFVSIIEISTTRSLEPGKDEKRFPIIQPADKNLCRGPLGDSHIRPAAIGWIWLPRPYEPTRDKGKRVVLHFHVGTYVMLCPRMPNKLGRRSWEKKCPP